MDMAMRYSILVEATRKRENQNPNSMYFNMRNQENYDYRLYKNVQKHAWPRYPGTHDNPSMVFDFFRCDYPVKFLRDNVQVFTGGLSSPKNCPMFKFLKENVQRLFESGITQTLKGIKLNSLLDYKEIFQVHENSITIVPLNLTMLEAGFVIWLTSVVISILVFFVEIIYFNLSNLMRKKLLRKPHKLKYDTKKLSSKLDLRKRVKFWLKYYYVLCISCVTCFRNSFREWRSNKN